MMKRLILLGIFVFGAVSAVQADIRLPWGHFEPGRHSEAQKEAVKKKQTIAYPYADVYTKSAVEEGVAKDF